MSEWLKGTFYPVNRSKCVNTKKIVYRSSYELRFMNYLDLNTNVIKWGSEVITIPYINEVDNEKHNYLVDFYAEILDVNKNLHRYLVEVKPKKQSEQLDESGNLLLPPPPKKKSQKALYNYQVSVNIIRKNHSKWKYAKEFCRKNGLEWLVITEDDLFPNR